MLPGVIIWIRAEPEAQSPDGKRVNDSLGSHGLEPSSSARWNSCQSLTQPAACHPESLAARTPVLRKAPAPVESPILPGSSSATTSRSFSGVPTCAPPDLA